MTEPQRRGGPPAWIAILGIGGLVLAVALIAVQSLGIGVRVGAPVATAVPAGPASERTRDILAGALADAAFQVTDPQVAYRPGESPTLITVPRRLLQVILPADPSSGFIVIYELPTNDEADAVGRDFARYLASGPGAIQYPQDERFVIRRVGDTLVYFTWSPTLSPDPSVASLAATLATIGEAVPAG